MSEPADAISQQMEAMLHRAIKQKANLHAKVVGLDEEQTETLKRIVEGIIMTMQLSAAVNATSHDLPIQVVFITLLETISDWNQSIDSMSKRPSPINN